MVSEMDMFDIFTFIEYYPMHTCIETLVSTLQVRVLSVYQLKITYEKNGAGLCDVVG